MHMCVYVCVVCLYLRIYLMFYFDIQIPIFSVNKNRYITVLVLVCEYCMVVYIYLYMFVSARVSGCCIFTFKDFKYRCSIFPSTAYFPVKYNIYIAIINSYVCVNASAFISIMCVVRVCAVLMYMPVLTDMCLGVCMRICMCAVYILYLYTFAFNIFPYFPCK